ncbi:Exocyst complex component EXO84 [Ophiocordyceps camponoti-floridani]|uniref:Exocyst complex component EXO84 n=1 Tax=Ophiocordyceps camponoti-floridani TaxID=2030778 RepID=A0A8H4Q663_9HYPO|nr:Exocyst complex component EXO84 [Ophiocordyceps camponoti-floridani]
MSDERSKISLRSGPKRKGRPTISAPRQISSPITHDGGPKAVESASRPRLRPAPMAGGKTSNLVKQRYSTRFNNPPVGLDVGMPPPMPALPTNFDRRAGMRPAKTQAAMSVAPRGPGAAPVLDVKALRDSKLVPDQFVSLTLSEASEDQIHDFEESLRSVKIRAANDLQHNLMQNRSQFIKISKEADKLKGEMRALRNLMADLKTNTDALRATSMKSADDDDSSTSFPLSKRDKRSSVADRSALWNSQMQALFKNVEGSQKFLPHAAGRHVVQNAGPWVELDNATYKSRRAMQIFLLNDHLLVASRKKRKADADARGGPPAVKLVADRCWPLLEIEVEAVDLPPAAETSSTSPTTTTTTTTNGGRSKLADAITVRRGGHESFIYRTEKPQDPEKRTLLLNVRKAVEELRRGRQTEMEANNKARETINYFASRDPGLLQKTELLETLSDIKDMRVEVDGKQQNLRWVEGQMDELDIDIALQRFEPAVALVEKLKGLARSLRSNYVARDFVNFKVDERGARLAGVIVRELETTHGEPGKTKRNVDWLTRLGFEDRAREAYLAARSEIIHKRTRQCIFQGDLHLYIWQLSFVYFTIIHNTVQCFQACFPTPMMSACVRWAKTEVEAFNEIMARQLSSTERGGAVWTQCLERAREHGKKLSQVGLGFEGLVGRGLDGEGARLGL